MPRNAKSLCHFCWTTFPDPGELAAHIELEHPGMRKRWLNDNGARSLVITDASGVETTLGPTELNRKYRELAKVRSVSRDVPGPTLANETPDAAHAPIGDNSPRLVRPQALDPGFVSRSSVESAFTIEFLAQTLQRGSAILSDWDGAGEAGTFTATEAAELARLLYTPTVNMIMERFHGDVNRFRMLIAAIIILGGKGRIHYQALSAKAALKNVTPEPDPYFASPTEPEPEPAPAATPKPGDPGYIEWMVRQSQNGGA